MHQELAFKILTEIDKVNKTGEGSLITLKTSDIESITIKIEKQVIIDLEYKNTIPKMLFSD